MYLSLNDSTLVANKVGNHSNGANAPTPFDMHRHSQPPFHGVTDIFECEGISREQWVGLDVVLLDHHGVPIANGILMNFTTHKCVEIIAITI